jgi:transposase
VATILEQLPHPEQGYRSCLGIKRLAKRYGIERIESACRRAVALDVCSYQSIKSMLNTGLDSQPLPETGNDTQLRGIHHENIRGRRYYESANEAEKGGYGDMG